MTPRLVGTKFAFTSHKPGGSTCSFRGIELAFAADRSRDESDRVGDREMAHKAQRRTTSAPQDGAASSLLVDSADPVIQEIERTRAAYLRHVAEGERLSTGVERLRAELAD